MKKYFMDINHILPKKVILVNRILWIESHFLGNLFRFALPYLMAVIERLHFLVSICFTIIFKWWCSNPYMFYAHIQWWHRIFWSRYLPRHLHWKRIPWGLSIGCAKELNEFFLSFQTLIKAAELLWNNISWILIIFAKESYIGEQYNVNLISYIGSLLRFALPYLMALKIL